MLLADAIEIIKKKIEDPYVDNGHKLELLGILKELSDFVKPRKKLPKDWWKQNEDIMNRLTELAKKDMS